MDTSRFQKVYANLPIAVRNQIVIVDDDHGPMTWNAVYVEIENNTELGQALYKKLLEMELI